MSAGDLVTVLLLTALCAWAFRSIRKSGRKGCTGCCSACSQACAGKSGKTRYDNCRPQGDSRTEA